MSESGRGEFVHVTTFRTSAEAKVAIVALQSKGIECQIAGKLQAGPAGVLPIDVFVHQVDLDDAKAIFEYSHENNE